MEPFQDINIPKLSSFRAEMNQGPMTYRDWKRQRLESVGDLYNALPGPIQNASVFEVHPYQDLYQPRMPQDPACYIIGTAPPASYMRAKVPGFNGFYDGQIEIDGKCLGSAPNLLFYHGNVGSFWDAIGFQANTVESILATLNHRKMRYDDICFSWSRCDFRSPADSDLTDIVPNIDLLEDVWNRLDKPFLWFTNSGVFGANGIPIHQNQNLQGSPGKVMSHRNNVTAYNLFLRAWQELGAEVSVRPSVQDDWVKLCVNNVRLLENTRHLIAHELRIQFRGSAREYPVLSGPSPSRVANRQLGNHRLYHEWCDAQGIKRNGNVANFKTHVYAGFLETIAENA